MVGRLLTAATTALLTAALLWGGCVACSPLATQGAAGSGCCEPSGRCKTPVPADPSHQHCTGPAIALERYSIQQDEPALQHAVAAASPLPIVSSALEFASTPRRLPMAPGPQLYRLHSTFRI